MNQTQTESPLRPGVVKVGDGVTAHVGSDRYAGTVTYVSASGKTIRYTHDTAKPNGPIHDREQYDYSYESNPEVTQEHVLPDNGYGEARWTTTNVNTAKWSEKRQRFMDHGTPLSAGRHHFYNPHF